MHCTLLSLPSHSLLHFLLTPCFSGFVTFACDKFVFFARLPLTSIMYSSISITHGSILSRRFDHYFVWLPDSSSRNAFLFARSSTGTVLMGCIRQCFLFKILSIFFHPEIPNVGHYNPVINYFILMSLLLVSGTFVSCLPKILKIPSSYMVLTIKRHDYLNVEEPGTV